MQHKKTLVLGGVKSGKTAWAENHAIALGKGRGRKPIYLATGQGFDGEMQTRINRHREQRGDTFETIEEPLTIATVIETRTVGEVVLLDSIGTWLTNLMLQGGDVGAMIETLLEAIQTSPASLIIVSEEVGLGVVPPNAMARAFIDYLGETNQRLAQNADTVMLVTAGIPLTLKG